MFEGFLLGIITAASITAGLFFFKFWRDTRDSFFLFFAASFLIEGINRSTILLLERPNEGSPWIYVVRLFAVLLILWAILKKNYSKT